MPVAHRPGLKPMQALFEETLVGGAQCLNGDTEGRCDRDRDRGVRLEFSQIIARVRMYRKASGIVVNCFGLFEDAKNTGSPFHLASFSGYTILGPYSIIQNTEYNIQPNTFANTSARTSKQECTKAEASEPSQKDCIKE
jgi:hypothetical protein